METIKKIKHKNFILEHFRYIDGFGFLVDGFELFDEIKRIHYPFRAPMKVTTFKKTDNISTTTNYSDLEYENIMTEQIKRYGNHNKQIN